MNESSPVDPGGRHYPSGLPLAIVARGSPSVGRQCPRLCKKAQSVALLGERGPCSLGSRSGPPCGHISCRRPGIVTWLILPVVICLSQRLSHACLSINDSIL